MKKGSKDGRTEFAKRAKPLCAARILSREKITSKTVKMQNRSGIKFLLNLKNITLILGILIKSPCIIYLKSHIYMQICSKSLKNWEKSGIIKLLK